MKITDRDISRQELEAIYADFAVIDLQDGIPDHPSARHQYVAEADGIIIGLASGLAQHRWFYLTDLWVHKDHRGTGLGSKLLAMLEKKVQSVGIAHMYTWTSGPGNTIFYQKQGYEIFAQFDNFYEVEGHHKVGFRKDFP